MADLPLQLLDGAQSLYKQYVAPYVSPTAISVLLVVIAITHAYLRSTAGAGAGAGAAGTEKSSSSASSSSGKSGSNKPKDIFDTFHRGKDKKDGAGKKSHSSEKPFGSSYYYAHNDPNRTGGYKDGLRMEDYVMNGPKLLAKGGKRVEDDGNAATKSNSDESGENDQEGTISSRQSDNSNSDDDGANDATNNAPSVPSRPPSLPSNSVPIARYMWDDEAVASGCSDVGKLMIDTLPNKPSSAPDIKWEGAGIGKADVTATIVGDDSRGLLIAIDRSDMATGMQPKHYHLYIRRMYGDVAEVKVVVKAKRLLVKLIKKKNRLNLWDKKNLKSWPRLSEGATSSSGDDIDESLFRRDTSAMPMPQAGTGGPDGLNEKLFGAPNLD